MKLHELRELIKLVNQSSIEELEWEKGKERIVIKKRACGSERDAVSGSDRRGGSRLPASRRYN